jgi:hypothetical protein
MEKVLLAFGYVELLADRIRLKGNKTYNEYNHFTDDYQSTEVYSSTEILLSAIASTEIEQHEQVCTLRLIYSGGIEELCFLESEKEIYELFKIELDRRIGLKGTDSMVGLLELEKLAELKEKGILTDSEFQAQKQKILNAEIDSTNIDKIKSLVAEQAKRHAKIIEQQAKEVAEKYKRLKEGERLKKEAEKKFNKTMCKIVGILIGSLFIALGLFADFPLEQTLSRLACLTMGIIPTPIFPYLIRKLSKERIRSVHWLIRSALFLALFIVLGKMSPKEASFSTVPEISTTSITQPTEYVMKTTLPELNSSNTKPSSQKMTKQEALELAQATYDRLTTNTMFIKLMNDTKQGNESLVYFTGPDAEYMGSNYTSPMLELLQKWPVFDSPNQKITNPFHSCYMAVDFAQTFGNTYEQEPSLQRSDDIQNTVNLITENLEACKNAIHQSEKSK